MRNRYFTMWRSQLQQEHKEQQLESQLKDLHNNELQKRIFTSLKQSFSKHKSLKQAEETVKTQRDTRVMKDVISALINMREVRQMRERCLQRLIDRLTYRVNAEVFYKIRNHAYLRSANQAAQEHYKQTVIKISFLRLREYQRRKAKEDNDFRIARRFRHVTLISNGFKAISKFKYMKQRQIEMKEAAQQMRKRSLLKKTWLLMNGVDEETLAKLKILRENQKKYNF